MVTKACEEMLKFSGACEAVLEMKNRTDKQKIVLINNLLLKACQNANLYTSLKEME